MNDRRTRGRASSIEQLPESVKRLLDKMLVKKECTQTEILDAINNELIAAGVPNVITKSSLNRYATRIETIGASMREKREIADVWASRLGDKPSGEVSQLLIEMLRSLAFDAALKATEDEEGASPALIKELALGIQRLERASEMSTKREQQLRKAFAEEAAATIEKKVASAGLSRETADSIKRDILGIA
jgi:hypothetical protein